MRLQGPYPEKSYRVVHTRHEIAAGVVVRYPSHVPVKSTVKAHSLIAQACWRRRSKVTLECSYEFSGINLPEHVECSYETSPQSVLFQPLGFSGRSLKGCPPLRKLSVVALDRPGFGPGADTGCHWTDSDSRPTAEGRYRTGVGQLPHPRRSFYCGFTSVYVGRHGEALGLTTSPPELVQWGLSTLEHLKNMPDCTKV